MNYPGGKGGSGVYQQIINQIPPHDVYIEAFVGGGAVFENKRSARLNILNDIDSDVVKCWQERTRAVPGVIAQCCDAISFLRDYKFKGNEFVYADPPYLGETRKGGVIYKHEMLDEESHLALLYQLRRLDCNVMVSGYWSELYADWLKDWRTISFPSVTRGGTVATEWLWMNYPKPTALHDYRYLGNNYRERERLKRIRVNMVNKIKRMDELERLMLSAAIAELSDAS